MKFKLARIKDIYFSLMEYEDEISEDKLRIGGSFKEFIKLEDEIVGLYISTTYSLKAKNEENTLLLRSDILFFYDVRDLNESEEDKNLFREKLLPALISISISTLRGILHMKTLGHKLNEFPIPLLSNEDILEMIKENQSTASEQVEK